MIALADAIGFGSGGAFVAVVYGVILSAVLPLFALAVLFFVPAGVLAIFPDFALAVGS